MKKLILIFIALTIGFVNNAFADEFVVKSIKVDASDISARKYERRDINDDKCALIKIRSDIEGIKFDPRLGAEGSVDFKNGEYWLYVSPGEKMIKIIKSGFISFDHMIPIKIKSSNVYKMELTGSDRFTIRVNTDPGNISFELDGIKQTSNTAIEDIAPGTHTLKIEKTMYATVIDTIYVSKTTLFFDYKLTALKRVLAKFTSNPTGAILLIDGNPIGSTPQDKFIYTGKHHLRMSLNKYIDIDTTVTLVEGKNNFNFNMIKNTSYAMVYKYPAEAVIRMNGLTYTAGVEHEIGATEQSINVTCDNYYPFDTTFIAEKGKKYIFTANLKRFSGNMMILSNPSDVNFELIKGEEDIILSWQGSNSLEDIATDMYKIRAFKKGYLEQLRPIVIKKEQTHEFEFNLEQLSTKKGSKFVALTLSAIIPGTGQLYSGQKRGWFYFLGISGGIATAYVMQGSVDEYIANKEKYNAATNPIEAAFYHDKMVDTYDNAIRDATIRDYDLMKAGELYGLNLLDALLFGKKKEVKKDKKMSVIAYPVNNTVAMGFSLKFQGKR